MWERVQSFLEGIKNAWVREEKANYLVGVWIQVLMSMLSTCSLASITGGAISSNTMALDVGDFQLADGTKFS